LSKLRVGKKKRWIRGNKKKKKRERGEKMQEGEDSNNN